MFRFLFRNNRKIRKLLDLGYGEESQNNLEAAYEAYKQAAALGSGKAMLAIGSLYQNKGFRMTEQSAIEHPINQGMPLFPWNVIKKTFPNHAAALEWYCKAAECGEAAGYVCAGVMLCEGIGSAPDLDKGLAYLNKAAAMGIEDAKSAIAIYSKAGDANISDEEYEKLLREFICAVEEEKPERYALYSVLKGGTDRQKTKLGYALVTRRNLNDPKYAAFKYLYDSNGMPLIPCCARRLNWKSFIRIDLNAFPNDDVLIAYSADFYDIDHTISSFGRLKKAGSAVYKSPSFGWLKEEKKAVVFRIDRKSFPDQMKMKRIADSNHLLPIEYAPDHVAFIIEDGEKEYSAEITAISDGKVQVLFRYTIGGCDHLQEICEPELLALNLDNA